MKTLILLLPVLVAITTSCSNIRSKQLVGAEPVDLTAVGAQDISGEWINKDGEVIGRIEVTNATKGEILFTPAKKEGEEQGEAAKISIRSSNDYVFLNYEPDEKGERRWYLLGGGNNEFLIWSPDNDAFRKLIADGKIKGRNDPDTKKDAQGNEVEKQNAGAVIDDPQGEWVEKLAAGGFGVPFDWKNPMVLRKKVVAK
ncbi:MAG: hypothetical protein H7A51_18060 [Akkermansiaceae bacterium]|nr:hypothetical protein [Akkermansiaceae bacterium]